jgi:hypothetical protein
VLTIVGFLFCFCWLLLRRSRLELHLQFPWLSAMLPTTTVALWYTARIAIVPQPTRYHLGMDLLLLLALVLSGESILSYLPPRARSATVATLLLGCAVQTYRFHGYANRLVQAVDKTSLSEYKIAMWLTKNRPRARAFLAGSTGFLFNAFTDNQQLLGGHDQRTRNGFLRIVNFTSYSETNAGDRDAEYSIFWLKAFGVHAVSMSGPRSTEAYKETVFAHPHKFEGVLPVLWRDRDDVIYEVPGRSESLAHVIPRFAVVTRAPLHGLDKAPAKNFVAALDDPRYAPAKV